MSEATQTARKSMKVKSDLHSVIKSISAIRRIKIDDAIDEMAAWFIKKYSKLIK